MKKNFRIFHISRFFFGKYDANETPISVSPNQESYILELIADRHSDEQFMQFIFSLICIFSITKRILFISKFLALNKSFEMFSKLPLESGLSSWSGSAVPMLQRRIDYYQSLTLLFDTVDFLKHKQHVEQIIKRIRVGMEHEKKRDFVND